MMKTECGVIVLALLTVIQTPDTIDIAVEW